MIVITCLGLQVRECISLPGLLHVYDTQIRGLQDVRPFLCCALLVDAQAAT